MLTAVLKADAVLDAVLDANCCPNNSQKMLDTKIMCCVLQQPHTHQPTQRLIHQQLCQSNIMKDLAEKELATHYRE
jgi:hypothetical protein